MDIDSLRLEDLKTFQDRVGKGVEWLNERMPGWRLRLKGAVERHELEMSCSAHGILGRLFSSDTDDWPGLFGTSRDEITSWQFAEMLTSYGFAVMQVAPVEPDAWMRTAYQAATGRPCPDDYWVPVPRDPSILVMETEALQHFWEKAILNA